MGTCTPGHVRQLWDTFRVARGGTLGPCVYLTPTYGDTFKAAQSRNRIFQAEGRIGGRTRALNLSASERSKQARKAVLARWAKRAEEVKGKKGTK